MLPLIPLILLLIIFILIIILAGLAHVIFMNAYTNYVAGSNQYNWLLADLMAVDRTLTPWILVNFHTPWYERTFSPLFWPDPTSPTNLKYRIVRKCMGVNETPSLLSTPLTTFIFFFFRYNTYQGKHNELEAFGMKKAMEGLFYKYHVNCAFSGHVHAYERFLPIYQNVTTVNATIYMTIGTGGQSYGKI